MVETLTKTHIDLLEQQLIVPRAVSDIMAHDLPVEPEMQYSLHMALSEIDPDSALLAIALCALDLAKKFYLEVPIAAALKKEANDIIGTYAPTWLRHHKNGPMKPELYADILRDVPEDLEALADIMDALCGDIDAKFSSVIAVAELLSMQARAHMEIADYLLGEIAGETEDRVAFEGGDGALEEDEISSLTANQPNGDNIILFPIDRAR